MITELATAYKLHTGGKARILAVATGRRLDDLPDIPTVIEAGVPGFLSDTWNAISAPPKTPAAIIAKLNRAVNATLDERNDTGNCIFCPVAAARRTWRSSRRERRSAGPG